MKSSILVLLLLTSISFYNYSEEIDIMFNSNYYPFEFINDEGLPDGFTIDLIFAIAREAAYTVNLIEESWKNKDDLLFNGVIDISPGYLMESENPLIISSKTLFTVIFSLLYKSDLKLSDERALKNKIQIISSGDSSQKLITSNNYSEKTIGTKSWSDSIKALSIGYGDFTIITKVQTGLSEIDLPDDIREMNNFKLNLAYGFYSAKWNKNIMDKMNNGISIIKASGEYDRIYEKWFGDSENLIIKHAENQRSIIIYVMTSIFLVVVILFYMNKRKVKK